MFRRNSLLKRFLCQEAVVMMCQVDERWGWSLRTWNVLKTPQGAGDSFVAVFGSPQPSSTHPLCGVFRAARAERKLWIGGDFSLMRGLTSVSFLEVTLFRTYNP